MISSFNADLSDCLVKLRNADKLHKKFLSIVLSILDGGIITSLFIGFWFLVFGRKITSKLRAITGLYSSYQKKKLVST